MQNLCNTCGTYATNSSFFVCQDQSSLRVNWNSPLRWWEWNTMLTILRRQDSIVKEHSVRGSQTGHTTCDSRVSCHPALAGPISFFKTPFLVNKDLILLCTSTSPAEARVPPHLTFESDPEDSPELESNETDSENESCTEDEPDSEDSDSDVSDDKIVSSPAASSKSAWVIVTNSIKGSRTCLRQPAVTQFPISLNLQESLKFLIKHVFLVLSQSDWALISKCPIPAAWRVVARTPTSKFKISRNALWKLWKLDWHFTLEMLKPGRKCLAPLKGTLHLLSRDVREHCRFCRLVHVHGSWSRFGSC